MYLLYFILWIVFNGAFTWEICLFGLVIAAVMFVFSCKFLGHSPAKEAGIYRRAGQLFRFIIVLLIEIVKANFSVVHMILTEREEIQPLLVSFSSDLKTHMGKAMLADAITLTPGTITVSLENRDYVVHCLDESLADGIDDSEFVHMIEKMER